MFDRREFLKRVTATVVAVPTAFNWIKDGVKPIVASIKQDAQITPSRANMFFSMNGIDYSKQIKNLVLDMHVERIEDPPLKQAYFRTCSPGLQTVNLKAKLKGIVYPPNWFTDLRPIEIIMRKWYTSTTKENPEYHGHFVATNIQNSSDKDSKTGKMVITTTIEFIGVGPVSCSK